MSAIRLTTLLGDQFNINGDQANLLVLQKRLAWLGFASEVISVASSDQLVASEAHFVLLGHGSLAANKSALSTWPSMAEDFLDATQKLPGLAVGSGASSISAAAGFSLSRLDEPISEFATEALDDLELLGYKFADVTPAVTHMVNEAVVTWLHGPILAKNPRLADALIIRILNAAGKEHPTISSNENTRKIDEILAGVWRLEKPQS
ncbi:MAG: hypothetical protein RL196_1022 [Actinomycetota bacterium]|jgi:CobQ-like glutamine amidotransferase family enzyme